MKKKRFTEEQIVRILGEVSSGQSVAETCRKYGVSEQTVYRWRNKFGGMGLSEVKRLKQLEDDNRQLRDIVADLNMDNKALKVLLSKKW